MNIVEEIESQSELISDHLATLIQDTKKRIRQFAASLIEPDVLSILRSSCIVKRSIVFSRTITDREACNASRSAFL